jgi:hypothetical protein
MTKPKGGARQGAGKPLINHKVSQIRLAPEQIEKARKIGGGNLSKGVRIAIERAT